MTYFSDDQLRNFSKSGLLERFKRVVTFSTCSAAFIAPYLMLAPSGVVAQSAEDGLKAVTFDNPIDGTCDNRNGPYRAIDAEPGPDQVMVYTLKDFKGNYWGADACAVLSVDKDAQSNTYRSTGFFGMADNSISSIKVGANVQLKLCRNKELKGRCQTFEGGTQIADLGTHRIGINKVSSAQVIRVRGRVDATTPLVFSKDRPGYIIDENGREIFFSTAELRARLCAREGHTGGCYDGGIGDSKEKTQWELNTVWLGDGIRIQVFPEPWFRGRSEIYSDGFKGKSIPYNSYKILGSGDTEIAYKRPSEEERLERVAAQREEVRLRSAEAERVRREEQERVAAAAKLAAETEARKAAEAKALAATQVRMPASDNTKIRQFNFGGDDGLISVPLTPDTSMASNIRFTSAASAASINQAQQGRKEFAFGLLADGYMAYSTGRGEWGILDWALYGQTAAPRRVKIQSDSRIVQITPPTIGRRGQGRVHGLTDSGQVMDGTYTYDGDIITSIRFEPVFEMRIKIVDLDTQEGNDKTVLADDGTIFQSGTVGNRFAEIGQTKFKKIVMRYSQIFGLDDENTLWSVAAGSGRRPSKVIDNVRDFAILDDGRFYYISSETGRLMGARETSEKAKALDENATFTRFLSKNLCVVENANGQTFVCE